MVTMISSVGGLTKACHSGRAVDCWLLAVGSFINCYWWRRTWTNASQTATWNRDTFGVQKLFAVRELQASHIDFATRNIVRVYVCVCVWRGGGGCDVSPWWKSIVLLSKMPRIGKKRGKKQWNSGVWCIIYKIISVKTGNSILYNECLLHKNE